jgi:hypothetical protein
MKSVREYDRFDKITCKTVYHQRANICFEKFDGVVVNSNGFMLTIDTGRIWQVTMKCFTDSRFAYTISSANENELFHAMYHSP